MKDGRIWISWERHRRTTELARAFQARLFVIEPSGRPVVRYPLAAFHTVRVVLKERPKVVFVQNPSLVLAGLASVLKRIFGFTLIVDRHTNFRLAKKPSLTPRVVAFNLLSGYSLRSADMTIVTNDHLKTIVGSKGGRGAVLTDKMPDLRISGRKVLRGQWNIVFISTYANDEPYRDVFEAARLLPSEIYIYVTGNPRNAKQGFPEELPANVVLTGFLDEQDFIDLLHSADGVMDLTTADWCLVCGGYEAMAVRKPFITSDKEVLRSYYTKGTVFTDNSAKGIEKAILRLIAEKDKLSGEIGRLRDEKTREWFSQYHSISCVIERLENQRKPLEVQTNK